MPITQYDNHESSSPAWVVWLVWIAICVGALGVIAWIAQ